MPEKNKLGVILSAGGARAAYQVGVLKYMGEHFTNFHPSIYSGVSAGSINAAYMAQGEKPEVAASNMYHLWENLQFDQVLKTNFKTIFAVTKKIFSDLFLSKVTKKLAFKSLLDATPLSHTLVAQIKFWKIAKSVRSGTIDGIAVSTMDYRNGTHCIFFDSHKQTPAWIRKNRRSVRTAIRIRHIMASCSIPVIFEPVPIGDSFFGDGAMGFSFPFSPAIHLGSTHILAIGLSAPPRRADVEVNTKRPLSLGMIAGALLNSMFVDNLESDYETLCRMNELAKHTKAIRPIQTLLISPTRDLGEMGSEHISEVPFHMKQLVKTASVDTEELGTLISYLMFTPGYLKSLLQLGYHDAENKHDEIAAFLQDAVG